MKCKFIECLRLNLALNIGVVSNKVLQYWSQVDRASERNWQKSSKTNDVQTKYSTLPSKKLSSSSSSTTSSRSKRRQPQPQISTVRLSSFGAEKVCPIVANDEDLTQEELYVSDINIIQTPANNLSKFSLTHAHIKCASENI